MEDPDLDGNPAIRGQSCRYSLDHWPSCRHRRQQTMQTGAAIAALNSGASATIDGGARNYSQQNAQQQQMERVLKRQSHVGTLSHLVAGGVAGAFSKTCTAPLARLTILFQVQGMHSDVSRLSKASIWREASRIACEEGIRAFWKGNLVTIVHRIPYSSISFSSYEHYKNFLELIPGLDKHKHNMGADVFVRLLGGGMAGITAATMTYPLDLIRTRLATQTNSIYYKSISHAFYTICKDEGVKGLYKGLGPTLVGVGPNIAISFSVYEIFRSNWQMQRPHDSTVMVSLACGSVSGIASSTVSFPLDLVRRRKQLEGVAGKAYVYNKGLLGTFKHIVQTEGFRGLYRGILPEYYKVIPSVSIVFMTYELLRNFLSESGAHD